nr:hypothetical protein [Hypnea edeniana]
MTKKIIYINKSVNKILLSIKTFDIYFLNTLKKNSHTYKSKNKIIKDHLLSEYKHIVNIYKIYQNLCLDEFQYISLIILKNYCNNTKLNINSKYNNRFKYLFNRYLIENIYIQHQKTHKIKNIKIAIIYMYVLNQIDNSCGFYKLIQYLLII